MDEADSPIPGADEVLVGDEPMPISMAAAAEYGNSIKNFEEVR
jgi:hypothetical protein